MNPEQTPKTPTSSDAPQGTRTQDSVDYRPLLAMDKVWPSVINQSLKLWVPTASGVLLLSLLVAPAWSINVMILVAVVYSGVVSSKVRKLKNGVWQQFAAANAWQLDLFSTPETALPPSLQFGRKRKLSPGIQARIDDADCELWAYTCVTGYGRSEETHNFTVARIPLPRELPHIQLLSNKLYDAIHSDLKDGEHLKLEGDFNDYFKLQVEKGQEIDVLAIITPDVMQAMIDYNKKEDIEILGSNLYLIVDEDKRDPKNMPVIIRSIIELRRQILENIRRPAKTPPAPAASAVPPSTPVPSPIAPASTPAAPQSQTPVSGTPASA